MLCTELGFMIQACSIVLNGLSYGIARLFKFLCSESIDDNY